MRSSRDPAETAKGDMVETRDQTQHGRAENGNISNSALQPLESACRMNELCPASRLHRTDYPTVELSLDEVRACITITRRMKGGDAHSLQEVHYPDISMNSDQVRSPVFIGNKLEIN